MMSAFMLPIYLATNKIQGEIQKEGTAEDRGTWIQERPLVGPNRPERGKLTHGNLQISKCLYIIIRSCNRHNC